MNANQIRPVAKFIGSSLTASFLSILAFLVLVKLSTTTPAEFSLDLNSTTPILGSFLAFMETRSFLGVVFLPFIVIFLFLKMRQLSWMLLTLSLFTFKISMIAPLFFG